MVDADAQAKIDALLKRAIELSRELSDEPIHRTWLELQQTINDPRRLGELTRHPRLERIYACEFNPLVRSTWGSVERYLKHQVAFSVTSSERGYWHFDRPQRARPVDVGETWRVRLNDWTYSIPRDIQHYVVWVNSPLFHPDLCDDDSDDRDSWQFVQTNGVSGLIDPATQTITSNELEPQERGPGREIAKFVRWRWPDSETAWFANPPRLQSVPGLAHFHVMVKIA